MFANSFQSGFLSIFYSIGSNPLALWDKQVKNGHIRRIVDEDIKSLVLEIAGTNVATTYITCPIQSRVSLGVQLPFLVMIIKNMKRYFTFEIQILDDKDMRRRFRISNFQSTTKVLPFCTTMPIGLCNGWNQVHFNLADFTKRAYGSTYMETTRVQVHANVRIRRIYFSDRLYSDQDMPTEFKLFAAPGAKPKEVEKRKESVTKAVEVQKTGEPVPEEVPPLPAPLEEEQPNVAGPSPVGTAMISDTEPEKEGEETGGEHMPPIEPGESGPLEGEVTPVEEVFHSETTGEGGDMPVEVSEGGQEGTEGEATEGGEGELTPVEEPATVPGETQAEVVPTEAEGTMTEEPPTTDEAVTTDAPPTEPTDTEEPPTPESVSPEPATTEEPTETENESP